MNAECILTDSGGLQKEAYWAKKPCITFRKDTEWIETIENGWNQLFDPLSQNLAEILDNKPNQWPNLYGDGKASNRIAEVIKRIHTF
jgi:UDP-N-acetylglucosamine 2-epimerase